MIPHRLGCLLLAKSGHSVLFCLAQSIVSLRQAISLFRLSISRNSLCQLHAQLLEERDSLVVHTLDGVVALECLEPWMDVAPVGTLERKLMIFNCEQQV